MSDLTGGINSNLLRCYWISLSLAWWFGSI